MRYHFLLPFAVTVFFCITSFNLPLEAQARFSGKWFSSLGNLELTTRSSSVSGTYLRGNASNGRVSGTLSYGGEILSGMWNVDQYGGRYILRAVKNNAGFYGRWWRENGRLGGSWIGVKQGTSLIKKSMQPEELNGIWHTNYGRMTLKLADGQISGDYRGSKNSGTINGSVDKRTNKFVAQWKDSKYDGKVIIQMMEGGEAFTGRWWYADGEYGGRWYGVRYKALSGCIQGNCDSTRGVYVWNDGSRYHGEWRKGMYHGSGQKYSSAGKLENSGVWINGLYQGRRTAGNVMNGSGTLKYANGDVYTGYFNDGEPDSTGSFTFANGNAFSGELKNGEPHGRGTYTWPNGDSYEGEFKLGRIEGEGIYTFANGDVYSGKFRRGQRYGAGDMSFASGDVYSGRWRADEISGRGVYQFSGGDSYKGQFRKGERSGRGTYTYRDSSSFTARWKDDEPTAILSSDGVADPSIEGITNAVLMKNKESQPTLPVNSALQNDAYVFYRQTETSVEEGDSRVSEVLFEYYVVFMEGSHSREAVVEFFTNETGLNQELFEVEVTSDPTQYIRQFANRFQFSILPTRLNSSGERYLWLR